PSERLPENTSLETSCDAISVRQQCQLLGDDFATGYATGPETELARSKPQVPKGSSGVGGRGRQPASRIALHASSAASYALSAASLARSNSWPAARRAPSWEAGML